MCRCIIRNAFIRKPKYNEIFFYFCYILMPQNLFRVSLVVLPTQDSLYQEFSRDIESLLESEENIMGPFCHLWASTESRAPQICALIILCVQNGSGGKRWSATLIRGDYQVRLPKTVSCHVFILFLGIWWRLQTFVTASSTDLWMPVIFMWIQIHLNITHYKTG